MTNKAQDMKPRRKYQFAQAVGLSSDEFKWSSSSLVKSPGHLLYLDQVLPKQDILRDSNRSANGGTLPNSRYVVENFEAVPPIVIPKAVPPEPGCFQSLQSWEGAVEIVGEDSFSALLIDKSGRMPDQIAELPIDEVSMPDRDLVQRGAIFYWNVGYYEDKSGKRIRESIIQFRRLPVWTRSEVDKAKRDAEQIGTQLGWE